MRIILTKKSGKAYPTDPTKFVRAITGRSISVLFVDTIEDQKGNVALVAAHEMGHVLGLTSRNPTNDEVTGNVDHDPGPFPVEYEADGLMKSGGPDSITGALPPNPGLWLPHEDWETANLSAEDYE